jgi:poly(3-hydroxybutyrate) depolymerase
VKRPTIHAVVWRLCLLLLGWAPQASALERLPSYLVRLDETSVSGISSGAYMAVQFAVSYASIVSGVGATAGGPFYCAGDEVSSLGPIDHVLARCMQGDPKYPAETIDERQMQRMFDATDAWARSGRIDATEELRKQKVWLFHGYNDGVVKAAVTDGLYAYFAHYVEPDHIFYKNNLNAGHAQITAACPVRGSVCNPCQHTGSDFLNRCSDDASGAAYDPVGSMLQHIYGTLQPKNTGRLSGRIIAFSQGEFARDDTGAAAPIKIALGDIGYLYVPEACARGETCRVHVAFHGCQQSADTIKDAFYRYSGYNEWADTNHMLVLYPQARPTMVPVVLPVNPQGCWDWWGYNDRFDSAGRYATRDGLQMAAVRRMLDRIASKQRPALPSAASAVPGAPPAGVVIGDFTHRQVELRWRAMPGCAYNVYRALAAGGPYEEAQKVNVHLLGTNTFVDEKRVPGTRYFYVVRAIDASGRESGNSAEVMVVTGPSPPTCDPYYSLERNVPVTKHGRPTSATCP